MHPGPGNGVTIGRAVMYYTWAGHAFGAGIKCPHCMTCRSNTDKQLLIPSSLYLSDCKCMFFGVLFDASKFFFNFCKTHVCFIS